MSGDRERYPNDQEEVIDGDVKLLPYKERKKLFFEKLLDPDFHHMTKMDQGRYFGVSNQTIWKWYQEVDWSKTTPELEKKYSESAAGVYTALTKKALKGDTRAIELWMQRFQGWSPKQISEVIQNSEFSKMDDVEIAKKLLNSLTPEQRKKALEPIELKVQEEMQEVKVANEVGET